MTCPDCARTAAALAQAEMALHTLKLEYEHRERVVATLKAKVLDLTATVAALEKKKGKK